jgi:competence protein ComGF
MIDTSIIHIEEIEKKKIIQCNGYGNCRMIFTRSEHLARHER